MVVSYLKFLHTPSYQYQHIIVTITDIHALFKPLVHMIVISPLLCFICILYFYVYNFSLRVSVSKFLFCIPDDGHTFGPKRVGFFTHKLISVYVSARRKPEMAHVCICWCHCCIQLWRFFR